MSKYVRLIGRSGDFLRLLSHEEARDLCKSGKATKAARGAIQYCSEGPPLLRFPTAQANRHTFEEHLPSGQRVWQFTRAAVRAAEFHYALRAEAAL